MIWTCLSVVSVEVVGRLCPFEKMRVSKNWGNPKWMAYNGQPY